MKIKEVAGVGKIVKGVNTTPDVQPGETERQAKKFFGGTGKPKKLVSSKTVANSTPNKLFNLGLAEKEDKEELKGFDPRTVKAINNLMIKFPQAKDPLSAIIADIEDSQAISIANDKHTRQRNIQQDKQIDDLAKRVDKLEKSNVTEDEDMDTIQRAEQFAQEAHKDHKRKYTGDPYYTHLDEVRRIVKAAGGSENMQAAALLHDTVEDTATTSQDIMKEFGPAIAKLVVELTDISKPEDGNRATRKAMDRDKLAGVSADAQTIKFADLISNGRDIGVNDPKFAKVYHKEKADLLRVMRKGDSNLRNAAIDMLPDELRSIATENLSYTGTERRRLEKKKGIEVGTPEWFKHWFDLPYLREGDSITYDELVNKAKYKSSIPYFMKNMMRTLHSLVTSGGNKHSIGYYAQEVGRQFGFSGRDLEKMYRKEYNTPETGLYKRFSEQQLDENPIIANIIRAIASRGYKVAKDVVTAWYKNAPPGLTPEQAADAVIKTGIGVGGIIKATSKKDVDEGKRIARKKGQKANSKKHSDLYTDENPKGTIHGLKFATVKDAEASVKKIKSSGKKHAHKIQAAIAMEQRAKAAGKKSAAAVYRRYINAMKKKTKKMNESTIQKVDIKQLETFADKLFGKVGIDVEFTKHFMDRVNDIRNQKPITMSELTRLFKQEYKRWGKPIAQLGPDSEAVMKDLQTDINLPFVLKWDSENNELDLVAKTVMRKADFKTNDREFPVENIVQEKNSKKDNIRLVLRIAKKLNIDPKIAMAIAYQESGFRDVIGDKNLKNKAYGLMQVRKPALDDVNRIYKTDFTMDDVANNPAKNVEIALKYFQAMKDNYGAESDEQALAGYNGGPNAIKGTNKKANIYAQSVIDTASTFKAPKKLAMQKPPARVYDTPIASNPQTVRPQVEPKKQLGPTPDASIIPPGTTKGGPSKLRQRLAKQAIKPDAQIDTPVVVKPKISKLRQRMMQKNKSPAVEPVTVSIPAPMPKLPTTYQDLAKNSGIKDPNKIFAGDIVNLPDGSKYTIKAGDTLSGIANFYNSGLKENVPNTNKPGTMGHMINWAGKNKPQAPTSRVQVARRPNKQEPQSWWQNVLQKGRNLFDGIESYTDPNFEVEWDEAKRYPEFVKIGKEKWIELAKTGKPIDVDNELANKIENTEAGEENRHEFDNLEEPKKERFRKAVKAGTVELPIIARYSDGYLELVAGNTRLTGMMNEFGEGKAWIFDVPDEVAVLGESEQLDLKKKFKITDELKQLDSIFKKDKHEIRIVGGAVRDLALGKTPKDIDLATDATPQEMQKMFDSAGVKHIPTGIEYGTITAVLNGKPYEITTLRADVETDGRRAEVEFVRNWEEDAKRRDLTYNAMSMDFEGNIYDYHGGMDDLQDKVTRFVGDPAERIKEDYLRTLRYFRFQGRLDTPTFDKDTMQAIASNTNGLKQLSVERVWMEMQKILGGGNIKQILGAMNNTGVLNAIGLKYTPNNDLMDGGDPIINLARITDDQSIGLRWKMSNEEKGKLGFLIAEKGKTHDKKWYTDMMVDGFDRTQLDALARYNNQDDMIQYIKTFKAPEFPVDGNDLIKIGHERGPGLGKTLMALRNKWKQGNFSASKDELLKNITEAPKDWGDMKLDSDKVQQSIDYFYTDHAPNKIGGRKEEGYFKGLKVVAFTKGNDTLMFLVNNQDQAVFYVAYSKFEGGVAVGNVRSNGTVKATEVYKMLVDKFGTLYSDAHQTPQGRKIWTDLTRFFPDLTVKDVGDRLVATKKIKENFADGKKKGKSRPGRVKRAGASCKGSVTSLRKKAKNSSGEKAKMYHWCANMKSGKNKSK